MIRAIVIEIDCAATGMGAASSSVDVGLIHHPPCTGVGGTGCLRALSRPLIGYLGQIVEAEPDRLKRKPVQLLYHAAACSLTLRRISIATRLTNILTQPLL